jgi:hypothetical protein
MLIKHIVAFVTLAAVLTSNAADLALFLTPPTGQIRVGDFPKFSVTITNRGSKAVTLTRPGDGSESHWRTPKIGWSVVPTSASEQKHPKSIPRFSGGRCGNVNSITDDEVFTLKAGSSITFSKWIDYPVFESAGTYRLVFYYQNDPRLAASGLALRPNEKSALTRMKQSTPCSLMSEEIIVNVLPAVPLAKAKPGEFWLPAIPNQK